MNLKIRLIIMSFLQIGIWGTWLISFGGYVGKELHFSGEQIGSFYATMGIASILMPAIIGILADKYIQAQKLLGICHLLGAVFLLSASFMDTYATLYSVMLCAVLVYMPTIALSNAVAYNALEKGKYDIVKAFPPIRVWGTVGFVVSMWAVDLLGFADQKEQFYLGAVASLLLGIYAFSLPACPVVKSEKNTSIVSALGLDAFVLFKQRKMLIFFIFSLLLGASLQITNTFGTPFLQSFELIPEYAESFGVQHPVILLSISQMSETLFILAIPFCLKRFGIKMVMLMSMMAWFLRFALFGLGDPGNGLWLLVLSMVVYGMAFDFFNISGSLFVELETKSKIRSSAQGLFMLMTNGFGAVIGGYGSGWIVDQFSRYEMIEGVNRLVSRHWPSIWYTFAAYSLVIAVVFALVFKYKHNPAAIDKVNH